MSRVVSELQEHWWTMMVVIGGAIWALVRWAFAVKYRLQRDEEEKKKEEAQRKAKEAECRADILERLSKMEAAIHEDSREQWAAINDLRQVMTDIRSSLSRIEGALSVK